MPVSSTCGRGYFFMTWRSVYINSFCCHFYCFRNENNSNKIEIYFDIYYLIRTFHVFFYVYRKRKRFKRETTNIRTSRSSIFCTTPWWWCSVLSFVSGNVNLLCLVTTQTKKVLCTYKQQFSSVLNLVSLKNWERNGKIYNLAFNYVNSCLPTSIDWKKKQKLCQKELRFTQIRALKPKN